MTDSSHMVSMDAFYLVCRYIKFDILASCIWWSTLLYQYIKIKQVGDNQYVQYMMHKNAFVVLEIVTNMGQVTTHAGQLNCHKGQVLKHQPIAAKFSAKSF